MNNIQKLLVKSIHSLNLLFQLEEDIQPSELDTIQDIGGRPAVLVDQHDAHEAKVGEHVLLLSFNLLMASSTVWDSPCAPSKSCPPCPTTPQWTRVILFWLICKERIMDKSLVRWREWLSQGEGGGSHQNFSNSLMTAEAKDSLTRELWSISAVRSKFVLATKFEVDQNHLELQWWSIVMSRTFSRSSLAAYIKSKEEFSWKVFLSWAQLFTVPESFLLFKNLPQHVVPPATRTSLSHFIDVLGAHRSYHRPVLSSLAL